MREGKVGFGIIGLGNMGSAHFRFINQLPNAEVTAICDIDPKAFEHIDAVAREKVHCYDDAEKLMCDSAVDVVLVAVPHYGHPDMGISAMEHGKHVIVEKPIAVHKKEAMRLLEAAAKHPELVKSGMFNQRTWNVHRKLKQLIDDGELGAIRRVNWTITTWFRTQSYYDSGNWRATWKGEGGGVLLNQCPHQLDLMQWLFGMPKRVTAFAYIGKYHTIEVEDEVNAYLEYEDGKVANFITNTGEAPGSNRLEITCERGKVIMEGGKIIFTRNEIETSKFRRESKDGFAIPQTWSCDISVAPDELEDHQTICKNVANAILNGEKLLAPLEEGIRGLELGNAMLYSALKKQTVELPLDENAYAELLADLVANSTCGDKKATSTLAADFNNSCRR